MFYIREIKKAFCKCHVVRECLVALSKRLCSVLVSADVANESH